jgi:hypothetical protein
MDFIEKVSVQKNHAFYSILFYFIINRKKQENMLRVDRLFSIIIFISLFITKHIEK